MNIKIWKKVEKAQWYPYNYKLNFYFLSNLFYLHSSSIQTKNNLSMKFNKLIPVYALLAAGLFASCETDKTEDETTSDSTTSTECATVVSSSDGPQTNDKFILIDSDFDEVNVDSLIDVTGSDKTWDFSGLLTGTEDDNDSIHFQDAALGDSSANFPNADFAFLEDGDEVYIQTQANGLNVVGVAIEGEASPTITNPLSYIPYSLKMGKTIVDEFEMMITMKDTIDTVISGFTLEDQPIILEVTQTNENEFIVDGCGTVVTPAGTFSCLRYVVEPGERVINGIISGYNASLGGDFSFALPSSEFEDEEGFNIFESKTYFWINKETKFPILTVTVDASGEIETVQYLKQ